MAREREGEKTAIEREKERNLNNAMKELARAKEELAKATKKKQDLTKDRSAGEAKTKQLQEDKKRYEKLIDVRCDHRRTSTSGTQASTAMQLRPKRQKTT